MTKTSFLTLFKTLKLCVTLAFAVISLILVTVIVTGCGKPMMTVRRGDVVAVAEEGKSTPFKIVLDEYCTTAVRGEAEIFRDAVKQKLGVSIDIVDTFEKQENLEYKIFYCTMAYPDCSSIIFELPENEFQITCGERSGTTFISVAWNGAAGRAATDALIDCIRDGLLSFDIDQSIKGVSKPMDSIITTNVSLRDPCVLLDSGVYYMYGTEWKCYKNTTGDLAGEWTGGEVCVTVPGDASTNHWAPEVYKLDDLGGYYMFTTYFSDKTGKRGVAVFKAANPEGPFDMISGGHVTPAEWDCIDGTLYYDKDGTPWMIFVHEWTGNEDGIGRMAVAKMSDDLTGFVTKPKDIFMGNEAPWATGNITDGPWIYTMQDGSLIMLWSNFDENGYACGMAVSKSGKIDGKWTQLTEPLFSKSISGDYDGGHGMIFRDAAGKLYLSVHSPNSKVKDRKTLAVFVPVKEEAGRLVADISYTLK